MTDETRHSSAVTGIDIWSLPAAQPGTGISAVDASGIEIRSSNGEEPTTASEQARAGLRVVAGGLSEDASHPTISQDGTKPATGLAESRSCHSAESSATMPEIDAPADNGERLSEAAKAKLTADYDAFDFATHLCAGFLKAMGIAEFSEADKERAAVALVASIEAQGSHQYGAMILRGQMAMTHGRAMECLSRASAADADGDAATRMAELGMAQRFLDTYARQFTALSAQCGDSTAVPASSELCQSLKKGGDPA